MTSAEYLEISIKKQLVNLMYHYERVYAYIDKDLTPIETIDDRDGHFIINMNVIGKKRTTYGTSFYVEHVANGLMMRELRHKAREMLEEVERENNEHTRKP